MRAPPLVSQNRYDGLSVNTVTDTVYSDSCKLANGRGTQETELCTPEACLISDLITESKSDLNDSQKPEEGVKDKKFFIRPARIEREILLSVILFPKLFNEFYLKNHEKMIFWKPFVGYL